MIYIWCMLFAAIVWTIFKPGAVIPKLLLILSGAGMVFMNDNTWVQIGGSLVMIGAGLGVFSGLRKGVRI